MILVTREPIDIEGLNASSLHSECGAVLTFSGTVRDHHHDRQVRQLSYETYEAMALSELERTVADCLKQWPDLKKIQIVHRLGRMNVMESSIYITVSSPHRADAFQALRFVLERIKQNLPIWKKEYYEDGESDWLHPNEGCSPDHLTLAELKNRTPRPCG